MKTRKSTKLLIFILSLAIFTSVFTSCNLINPHEEDQREEKYLKAYELLEKRDYEEAYALFLELGDYKDATKEASRFYYMPTNHYVKYDYQGEEEIDMYSVTYTVTLNDQNLPVTIVQEYPYADFKHTCVITRNELGHVTRRECSDTAGFTSLYEATYDENGNVLCEIYTDIKGNVSKYDFTYNDKGQLAKVVSTNAPSDDFLSYVCEYDEEGREIKVVFEYAEGYYIQEKAYDADGNFVNETWATEDGVYIDYEYHYDENGRHVETTYKEYGEYVGTRKITYNDKGQMITDHEYYIFDYEYTYNYKYDESSNSTKKFYSSSNDYKELTVSEYKLVYIPFDYNEYVWGEIIDSTMCYDSTHNHYW